jgi:hypothetical protein
VLPVVHDADHDGTRLRGHLDEVEAGLLGDSSCFIEGNDADLLAVGADESDRTQADLIVDAYLIVDSTPP